MKPSVLKATLAALCFWGLSASAVDVSNSIQSAKTKYPELAIEQSPLNQKFLLLVKQAREQEPILFNRYDWPMIIAQRASVAFEKEKTELLETRNTMAAAEKGDAKAQCDLGIWYKDQGNYSEGLKWIRKATGQGLASAQRILSRMYFNGQGVEKNEAEAAKWMLKAAGQGEPDAQIWLGQMYSFGQGVPNDQVEAVKWFRKAAEQGDANAQWLLAYRYEIGQGVPKSRVQAYMWYSLSVAGGNDEPRKEIAVLEANMLPVEIAEAQRLAQEFKPRRRAQPPENRAGLGVVDAGPIASGTRFFLTSDGYFVTNHHVVKNSTKVLLKTRDGEFPAKIIKLDPANDLAVLKVEGSFVALAIVPSRMVRLGATVATVGFPNPDLQGFAPKLAKGEIASLAGVKDDPHTFQISVPLQPGNSGGPLVDEMGNLIGVVVAKLSQKAALATSGTLAENVNYAVKSSYLLSLLESMPELATKLEKPKLQVSKFEDMIQDIQKATALVLVF